MKITITDGNNFINLDVDSDQLIEDVKALIEVEVAIHRCRLRFQAIRSNSSSREILLWTAIRSLRREFTKEP